MSEPLIEGIPKQFLDTLMNIVGWIVDTINSIIFSFSKEYTEGIVLIISVVIGIALMKKYKEKWHFAIVLSLLIFGFLRWLGVGG